jgi:hypothetical protein
MQHVHYHAQRWLELCAQLQQCQQQRLHELRRQPAD